VCVCVCVVGLLVGVFFEAFVAFVCEREIFFLVVLVFTCSYDRDIYFTQEI
jgi:uncharacterized membrane protein YbjE (DUF340 family)